MQSLKAQLCQRRINYQQMSLIRLIVILPKNNVFFTVVAMELRNQNFMEIVPILSKEKLEIYSFPASFRDIIIFLFICTISYDKRTTLVAYEITEKK